MYSVEDILNRSLYCARSNEYSYGIMDFSNLEESALQGLREAALDAAQHAYAPYSGFRVGAALLLDDGSVVTGCNVENASYGLTICAERSAMAQAVSRFGPEVLLRAVFIVNLNEAASSPCGACRQVLAEFAAPDAPVYFPTEDGETMQTIAALLPHGFAWNAP